MYVLMVYLPELFTMFSPVCLRLKLYPNCIYNLDELFQNKVSIERVFRAGKTTEPQSAINNREAVEIVAYFEREHKAPN